MTTLKQVDLNQAEINPAIGSSIRATKSQLLSGELAAQIRRLLEARGVLVFPRVNFSEEEQIAFTRTLGQYVPDRKDGGATQITIDPRKTGAAANYTKSSFFWHFDGYMNSIPILGSMLCCVAPSATGGNTEFCNTYAAWDALPEDRKKALEGLKVVHAMVGAQLSVEPEPSYETFSKWLEVPNSTLPIVWKHRSGRKSLVIGNTAVNVLGMNPLDGLELLVWLRDWATQERFKLSHAWSPGDAVLWDNTGTLHRATPYPVDSERTMRRTKLAGEEPII
jgi:alpha-ketoglutarate-dependent taurine dioxygenase